MSNTKFVNVDENGNLAPSRSSDALLQQVIADLAEYKRSNDEVVKDLKAKNKTLSEALNNCVVNGQTIQLYLVGAGVHIYGGSGWKISYGDSPNYGGDTFRIYKT